MSATMTGQCPEWCANPSDADGHVCGSDSILGDGYGTSLVILMREPGKAPVMDVDIGGEFSAKEVRAICADLMAGADVLETEQT